MLALLSAGAAMPAMAQWQRMVFSGKGPWTDAPVAHSLSYFTANPFLRDDACDLCAACTPADKAASARRFKVQTTVRTLGVLAGFRVLDVLYRLGPREAAGPNDVKWKSILVEVGKDQFREIFHFQAFYYTVPLSSSRIVQSGAEQVLVTMDPVGGNGGGCWEAYWWFDRAGPHGLDFSRLNAAMREGAPANTTFLTSCSVLNLETQEVKTWAQKSDAKCHACDYLGKLTARFRLNGSTVLPVEVRFQPGNP